METIKNYLDNMFGNLPVTAEVLKAKEELLQMMEDKYNELIEDGLADNAAIGTVISEFGNLDEISNELGINDIVSASCEDTRREITIGETKEFIEASKKKAFKIALGVAFCILSITGPIVASSFELKGAAEGVITGFGVVFLFAMVAAGVIMFVYSSLNMKKWSFIDKEKCRLSSSTADYVKEEEEAYTPKYALKLSVGIALCIMSVIPPAFLGEIEDVTSSPIDIGDFSAAIMFVFVAVGVFLIVDAANNKAAYDKLLRFTRMKLKVNNQTRVDENGNKYQAVASSETGNVYVYEDEDNEDNVEYKSETAKLIMEIYWPVITCIYLCWSFMTFRWYISWIIWPLAAAVRSILKPILKKR